jgi:hypothetical protein
LPTLALLAPIIKSSKPSPLTSPALETDQPLKSYGADKFYVIFGKTDTVAIDLAKLGGDSKYAINYLGVINHLN